MQGGFLSQAPSSSTQGKHWDIFICHCFLHCWKCSILFTFPQNVHSQVKWRKNNGLLKAEKGCCNYPKSWCFVHNFSSFLTAIWALPYVQVSSLCPKPLFSCLLAHLIRKASFSVTLGKAQILIPGPDLHTLSPDGPGRTKAMNILTSATPGCCGVTPASYESE